jgi:hypothetical protein
MTLAVAWERTVGRHSELVFASDSRLSQGGKWDACPKVFTLPRSDALLAIAGSTFWAYPFAMQIVNTIGAWAPSRNHQRDLRELPRHLRELMNSMVHQGDTFTGGYNEPLTEILLGGWSWQAERFRLWRFHYVHADGAFRHATVTRKPPGTWKFIGDRNEEDERENVVPYAEERLRQMLQERGKWDEGPLDMEPFEILCEVIREDHFHTVGGPPQVAKVYRHMNTQRFIVPWPNADGPATYGGRVLLEHEGLNVPAINPDEPELHARTRRAKEPVPVESALDIESLLLNAVEDAGRPAVEELVEVVASQGAEADVATVSRRLEQAAERGLVVRGDDARWTLVEAENEE